ncbi:MAG: response regulator, partial [Dehalococcoidia bacterium]
MKLLVLVVEDNEDSRYLLEKILQGYGHKVMAAADGAEALEQALAQPPDIIVSDILMPKMDGYQLCRECKQNEQLKNIPFIFYTATYTREEDEKFALSLGAETFIVKPTEPDVLVQKLSEIVEKARSGALAPAEVAPLEPSLFLAEHDKRIFAKLEDKVAQLEAEITQRKKAEERIKHLNLVLKAIRSVNQLIVREKDRDQLLKSACDNLIKTRGFHNAWIAILDESGGLVTYAEAGLGEDFLPMIEQLKRGELPDCARRALKQPDIVVIKDPISTCGECSLAEKCRGRGVMAICLEHSGKAYGLLVTSVPVEFVADEEEQSLFQEVAGDIAFALHDMELEEERKRLEHSLKERVKELQCLYDIGNIAQRLDVTSDEIYQGVVNLLPPAWQYPEITCARITINDKEFRTKNYAESRWKLSADIKIGETKVGSVEVGYLEARPELDKGPFLKEERQLIDAVAERLGRITEHKEAEEALKESEERYRSLVSNIPDVVWTEDENDGIVFVSPNIERLTGYTQEETYQLGNWMKWFDRFLHPGDIEHAKTVSKKAYKGEKPYDIEYRLKRKDGQWIWVNDRSVGTYEKDGKLYADGLFTDITELKRAEEEIKRVAEEWGTTFDSITDS